MPPQPPDHAMIEPRSVPSPALGFAIGVAVAGAATIAILALVMRAALEFEQGVATNYYGIAGGMSLGAIGGFSGGWLSWRRFSGGLPVSRKNLLGLIVATTVLSLLIGCLVGVVIMIIALVGGATGGSRASMDAVVGFSFYLAVVIAPVLALVFLCPIFGPLVALWTLAWRHRVNRQLMS